MSQKYADTSTKIGLSPTGKECKSKKKLKVVIGATALTGAALAKRLMKKSDKKESFQTGEMK